MIEVMKAEISGLVLLLIIVDSGADTGLLVIEN